MLSVCLQKLLLDKFGAACTRSRAKQINKNDSVRKRVEVNVEGVELFRIIL